MAGGVVLTGVSLGAAGARGSRLADSRIDVLLDESIGTIAPEIYGHFVEHLGGVVYDGIWVGESSSIPNIGGIRRAIVEALRPIRPSVIRWPGGCFADSYDWRDGIGPRERRPRRTNFWIDQRALRELGNVPAKYDTNHFGTNEFVRFCRLVDAQPYLAVNLRSLPARAFFEWLEYCNSPAGSTTLAEQREAGGEREPFGVKYWGIGNESWGCGGNFTPEEYAAEYRRFATWAVPDYGVDLSFIGSGPSGRDLEWTRRFFRALNERRDLNRMWGWGLHHYTSAPNGEAIAFDDTAWYDLLSSANRMDSLITAQWQVMGEMDREHRIKLVVDEWGAWHRMTTNVDPTHLFGQQSTIRDALVAGLTLDTFNRHADKVAMANIAQLVNCIQSLFLADEDRFLLTPTYHVFAVYTAHQGARSVRTVMSAPTVHWRDGEERDQSLWGLNGSASVRDDALTLTVTNSHLTEPRETEITVRGAPVGAIMATTLTARNVHDHNTFEEPDTVVPTTADVRGGRSPFVYRFPAASVTKLEIALRR
ncbi:MAG: alpha-L-arabinofuranosidase [Gemmatimonadales bacterium]|nr:alpha-L-arabinofuranosidase [Gemmatimonadales bacterium]NIN12919.1 alpha-L-arabinofuranosidase [Gemmatimonadales bacterium]NIR02207.1 alpha-L-arabinofuranosidase [Gemmatimonadales bacterium]NIS65999.1 alpha-L-arabinofuranosidase [Gemmatimonadales bacterium]